jgi:hypothetical protein
MPEHVLLPHPKTISIKPEQVLEDETTILLKSDKIHRKIKHVASSLKIKFVPCQENCLVVRIIIPLQFGHALFHQVQKKPPRKNTVHKC